MKYLEEYLRSPVRVAKSCMSKKKSISGGFSLKLAQLDMISLQKGELNLQN